MAFEFDLSDLRKLEANLGAAPERVTAKGRVLVRGTSALIERDGKINAPVDTGNLMNSIGTSHDPDGLGAEIGPTAHYGIYVEVGTSRMAGQPYMGPAADRHEPGFVQGAAPLAQDALGGG